jgi:hypothetical protein
MPEFGQNFRTQVTVRLQAEGLDMADKLTQEMARVSREIAKVREEFRAGGLVAGIYKKELGDLVGQMNFLVKEYDAVVGAADKLEAGAAKVAAAYAKQEAAAEKAAMAQVSLAQRASLAVEAASNRINALLSKEAADQLAAAERKAAIDAQAGARHEAELQQIHQAHLAFLAKGETAEQAANARHEAELQGMHQRHLAFLAKEESAEAAAAQRKADVESRAGATYEAELERMHQSHVAFLAREEAAEAAANARHEAELQQMHQSHQQFLAGEAAAEQAAQSRHDGEMEQAYRKHMEFLAKDASAEEAAGARHEAEMAELANKHVAFLGQEEAAEVAATAKHEAELQRMHQAHLEFLAKEAAAEAQAQARHDAEMGQAHQRHMEFLAREQAADQAAIDALQRQKDEALQREANRRRNADATFNEGTARRDAQQQIQALQDLGQQAISTGDRFRALTDEWRKLSDAGQGFGARGNAILDQLDHLREGLAKTGYQVQTVTGAFEDNNRVINAGAGYARKHWTEFEWLTKHVEGVGWAFKSTAKAGEEGGEGAKKASYGWLHFAHAVQDAQYGVGAVLNNIPLVVQALGGGPGLAGTVMIAAVAFETFRGYIGDVRTELGMIVDPMQAFARSSADLKAKLAALEAKKWKVDVDYRDIEMATEALKKHKEAEAAYEAGKKTKAQGALAEEAKKVVDAAGGTPELSKVVLGAAMAQGMSFAKQSDIEEEKRLRDQVAQIEKTKAGALPGVRWVMEKQAQAIEAQRKEIEERIQKANNDYAMQVTGKLAEGNEDAIRMIKGLAERQPQAFKPDARRRLKELTETAEEKEWKDMAEEADKFIDEQVEEGKKLKAKMIDDRRHADEALISKHAAAFGAKKALGGLIEAETQKMLAGGEKEPARLQAAARAIAEADIKKSGFVPEGLVPAVAAKVAEPHVEAAVAQTIAGAAPGQDVVAAARAAIAAEEAKAKAKEEKPEIAHEAARIGHEANEAIRASILSRASANETVEKMRGELIPFLTKRAEQAKVAPEIAPEVAAKLFDEQLGKLRAEMVGRGGVNARTARMLMGEHEAKVAGQEQGRERHLERGQDIMRRPAIAQEIMFRSGGMASPEQAEHGAEQYQSLINRGVAPPIAANRVMQELARMIQQQRAIMDQTNAMMNGMAGMLNQANQHLGMVGANQGMMRGQMNNMRWQKPAPWNTIPGG